jgi:hypothetical protein
MEKIIEKSPLDIQQPIKEKFGSEHLTYANLMEKVINRIIAENVEDMEATIKARQKNIAKAPFFIMVDHTQRTDNFTEHPSHKDTFLIEIMDAIDEINENFESKKNITNEEKRKLITELTAKVIKKVHRKFTKFKEAFIPADRHLLDADSVQDIQQEIANQLAQDIDLLGNQENLEKKWGEKENNKIYAMLLGKTSVDVNDKRYDETLEVLKRSEILAYYLGREGSINNWGDFDGSKRAQGYIYSKNEALIFFDIAQGIKLLKDNGIDTDEEIIKSYKKIDEKFHENAKINDSLTQELTKMTPQSILVKDKKAGIIEYRDATDSDKEVIYAKPILVKFMEAITKERKKMLDELKEISNLIKYNLAENNIRHIFLEERVQFDARLDNKSIQAARNLRQKDEEMTKVGFSKIKVDYAQYDLLRHILKQAIELNEIAKNTKCHGNEQDLNDLAKKHGVDLKQRNIIPDIIIANCQGADDVEILYREIDRIARDYGERNDCNNLAKSREIAIVPLFESKATTSPDFIKKYLNKIWDFCQKETTTEDDAKNLINKRFNEIFVAGSDLSKEMGQAAALSAFDDVCVEVAVFNVIHDTNIRVKLGSGGSAARQGGNLDKRGYNSMLRGKLRDDYKPDEIETRNTPLQDEIKKQKDFIVDLQDVYKNNLSKGEKPEDMFIKEPQGLVRLFKILPLMNHATIQSRSEELMVTMGNQRLAKIFDKIKKLADENRKRFEEFKNKAEYKDENDLREQIKKEFGLKLAYKEAANKQEEFVKKVIADKESGIKGGLGLVLEACNKILPKILLRNRPLSRPSDITEIIQFLDKMQEPKIDARAIGVNTISGAIYPINLIGRGAMLKYAKEQGTLQEVCKKEYAEEILHQIKIYGTIIDDALKIMESNGQQELAKLLKEDWKKLNDPEIIKELQNAMWSQISSTSFDLNQMKSQEKEQLALNFIPQLREILDPNFNNKKGFKSEWIDLFRKNYDKHNKIIEKVFKYLNIAYKFKTEFQKAVKRSGNDDNEQKLLKTLIEGKSDNKELQILYNQMKNADDKIQKINESEYGEFLIVMLSCYDPGA